MQELNIVELIEKNPISKLSKAYNNKLINKIKDNFTDFESQLFVSSFYCYLNYDKNIDFVVDLDNIWKWLGFSQKIRAKECLEKYFKLDIDYKNLAFSDGKASSNNENLAHATSEASSNDEKWGGHNKQTILLTIKCFKSLCLKAQTKKAGEIHEYYMKMEEVLHQIVEEETDELRLQLEQKENIILEIKQNSEQEKQQLIQNSKKEKQKAVEQAIIVHFPLNTECIYIGTIDNTNEANEKLIKFGHTNDLATRLNDHRKGYENFILVEAFKVQNKVEIENLIKTYPKIKRQIRSIQLNGKNKTELIAYDSTNFTIELLTKHIKDIIHSKTYSIDNFNRIMKLNEDLENKIRELEEQNKKLEIENRELEIENKKLKEQPNIITNQIETQIVFTPKTESEMDKKFNEFISSDCIVRPDVEEYSVNMEGRYRLWSQVKPTKEVFHAFKSYLDARFKPKRIEANHGYSGIKLKPVEYKKSRENSNVETFIFQVCQFSDCGKVLNSVLLSEYQKWKVSVGKELSENDMKEIKEYLNESPYALKSVVWTDEGNNEGYYGLSIKKHEYSPKLICSTGKKVYKKEDKTDILLATWDTIAKAAKAEGISTAKMSRSVKNKIIINDYYYSVI
uniref:MSV199 domain-containing protein n=1 Tax=viral metagenome TaxID=1070528 RepID=A0A6C0I9C4_9ZZZZ